MGAKPADDLEGGSLFCLELLQIFLNTAPAKARVFEFATGRPLRKESASYTTAIHSDLRGNIELSRQTRQYTVNIAGLQQLFPKILLHQFARQAGKHFQVRAIGA